MPVLRFRRASREDLPELIALLADDVLGASRENATIGALALYEEAFDQIDTDPNQYLCVAQEGDEIVGTMPLTFISGLSRRGAKRGMIEAVRVAKAHRGRKVGEAMFDWAITECRKRGCAFVQLTTDKARTEAHRFYDKLGFEASHIGYKLIL